jgi:predicted ATPase
MVMTARPEFVSPWPGHPHVTVLSLPRLAPAHARHLVESVAGRTLPRELASRILAPTEGVPLFIEEVAKSVLELGILPHDRELLDPDDVVVAIPGTLQASLMARLDRLGPGREIAQIGAVIGREFSYELLQLVAAMPEPALHAALERVTASELTYCRGSPPLATYVFKHVLVRDAAYGSLVRSHRQELHAAVARGIEAAFPEVVESEPELLAHHHREAGQTGKAVGYLLIAAERALSRSATTEALALLGNGLAMLGSLPEGRETLQQALALQIALGRALIAARGYSAPETREAYQRARMLCEATRNEMLLPTVILAEWVAAWTSADHTRALERAQQLRRWAERDGGEPAEAAFGHLGGGMTLTLLGRFTEARFHLESALAIGCFTPPGRSPFLASDADGRISALTYLHDCLMLLGWLDEAEATRNKAIAERPTQLYSLAMGHAHLARMHVLRRDIEGVAAAASAAQRTSEQQGYPFLAATGMVYAGWALAQRGSAADGITVCCEGIGRLQALGAICWFPRYYAHLAECYDKADDPEGGLRAIADGLQTMRTTGEHAWEAELHRLKARFLIRTGELEEAEQCLAQALTVARGQQARLLELRAATSLARLLAQTNDHARARAVLGDACAWFKQGAISADVVEAKAAISAVS